MSCLCPDCARGEPIAEIDVNRRAWDKAEVPSLKSVSAKRVTANP
jgi:hypothetical protein